ncbi:MAG: protein kinase [bacterium]
MIGQTISHYMVTEKLGEGGMGVVYKAEDIMLNRTVALKILPSDLTRDNEAIGRFINEAQAASALDHPNICTIHEIDETETGQVFICLAYYEGETLRERINRGPLPVKEAIDIAIQLSRGLARAHEAGIIHRDIKPSNIILTHRGEVKIIDFGIAKLAGQRHLTKEGMIVGTMAYMSPEQLQAKDVDHRTDIWALGVMLYEMLTGQLPFKSDFDMTTIYSILNEEPMSLNDLNPELPRELETVVRRAMTKDPDERYLNMNEVLDALSSFNAELESGQTKQRHFNFGLLTRRRGFTKISMATLMILIMVAGVLFWERAAQKNAHQKLSKESNGPFRITKTTSASIAVLPFIDLSPQGNQEYFCDGIAEELINAFTKVEGLRVVSRTSAFQFKSVAQDIRQIGKQLNVDKILEGSLRKENQKLRITAKLSNVEDGYNIWSETYEREMQDVFAIQDDITRAIVSTLKLRLVNGKNIPLVHRYTENFEAYNLYLMGRHYWNKRTDDGLKKGIVYFEKAVAMEPNYALAYVGIADSYLAFANYGALPSNLVMPKAKKAAEKAIKVDSTVADAHASLGVVKAVFEWDWKGAEREFKKAVELNPGSVDALHFYAHYLSWVGLFDEAINAFKQAQKLDPLSIIINTDMAWSYHLAHQYDRALEHYQHALELEENFFLTHFLLGQTYEQKGMYPEAIAEFQKAVKLSRGLALIVGGLGHAYAVSGRTAEALKVLAELNERAKHEYVSAYNLAVIYAGLGDKDQAFKWLEKACGERFSWLVFLKVEPIFDSLRSDPRFTVLLQKMGLQ